MFYLAAALVAASSAPAFHYAAEPVATPPAARFVIRDTIWKCGPSGCVGSESNSRPAIVCAALVKEVGALRGFSAAGKPFAAEELEKCNASAR
jgi:hypothetical protein